MEDCKQTNHKHEDGEWKQESHHYYLNSGGEVLRVFSPIDRPNVGEIIFLNDRCYTITRIVFEPILIEFRMFLEEEE